MRPYSPRYSASHGLVVGINEYEVAGRLTCATNDALGVAEALKKLDFPAENVRVLLDGAATKQAISEAFLEFAREDAEPDARLVFFFAGHGTTVKTPRGEIGFLVPVEGDAQKIATLLRWDQLTRDADLLPAKHVLFLMDACYGGLAIKRTTKPGSTRFLTDMLIRRARQVLTAGKADELVADVGGPRAGHSVFTGHLLNALEGAASIENGVLTASTVTAYVYQQVGHDPDSQQTPHHGHLEGDGDMILRGVPQVSTEDGAIEELVTLPAPPQTTEEQSPVTTLDLAKQLIAEGKERIRLHDVVSQEIRVVLSRTATDSFSVQAKWSLEEFVGRVGRYGDALSELAKLQALLGYWGTPPHRRTQSLALRHMSGRLGTDAGNAGFLALRWYPLLLLTYAGGVSAVAQGNYETLFDLLTTKVPRADGPPMIDGIIGNMYDLPQDAYRALPGCDQRRTPLSDHLFGLLQPWLDDLFFLGPDYSPAFNRFELLSSLQYAYLSGQNDPWGPPGRWVWSEPDLRRKLAQEVEHDGQAWPPIGAGLFGGTLENFWTVMKTARIQA